MPRCFFTETMCTIKFEIKEPGPVAIKVVNVIKLTQSTFFRSYDYPGQYEFDFNEKQLKNAGKYYYRIYDIKGLNSIAIKALDGKDRLLDSGNLENGTNGFKKLFKY